MPQVDPRLRGDDEPQERGGDFPRQNKKKKPPRPAVLFRAGKGFVDNQTPLRG